MKTIIAAALLCFSVSSCKTPQQSSGSDLQDGGYGVITCDQLIRQSQNDARRLGIDPFPTFLQNKETWLATLQKQGNRAGYQDIKACTMPGSRERSIDIALDCAFGEAKDRIGGFHEYAAILASCIEIKMTHNGSYAAAISSSGCTSKIVETFSEAAGAAAASAFAKTFAGWVKAVQCGGGITINLAGGALESWTADVNRHWRPGETHLDGRAVTGTNDPQKEQWETNKCNFGGNIPGREFWPARNGRNDCLTGCQDYTVTGFFSRTDPARSACLSKCQHICNKCCSGSSCQKPHLPYGNSDGAPNCRWE